MSRHPARPYYMHMATLEQRDTQILKYISQFQQLTSKQIHQLVFHEAKSQHPTYTALRRLLAKGYIRRIDRLLPGGDKGGAGQYVYVLSRTGWHLLGDDDTNRYRRINAERLHSLAIADTFIGVVRKHRAGTLILDSYATEPESHLVVGGDVLKPDLYVELTKPYAQLMFEIDMDTQSDKQILDKFARYLRAQKYKSAEYSWPETQGVYFVAVHDERADKLKRLLTRLPMDSQRLFRVRTAAELYTGL